MFNLGLGELILLFFIAFVVIGPSDFPKVLKSVLKALRYAKNLATDIMKTVSVNLEDEAKEIIEVKNTVEDAVKFVQPGNLLETVKNEVAPIVEEFSELKKGVESINKSIESEMDASNKGEKSIKTD